MPNGALPCEVCRERPAKALDFCEPCGQSFDAVVVQGGGEVIRWAARRARRFAQRRAQRPPRAVVADSENLAERVRQFLEGVAQADRRALFDLLTHRAACSAGLAGHPTLPVREVGALFSVSALGLLNGLIGGAPLLVMVTDGDNLVRFDVRRRRCR